MIALGKQLNERGHHVTLQTWQRWQEQIESEGLQFSPAPEYKVFPTREQPLKPYQAVVRATEQTQPLIEELQPDLVVADILTLAPALAAQRAQKPHATLVPHVYPVTPPGFPPYGLGARLPRTPVGRLAWRTLEWPLAIGLRKGRAELNQTRARLGLQALSYCHGGISRELCLVATLPELEYPRRWPTNTHVIGPLLWEPQTQALNLPAGEDPLILIAPSTSQDRGHHLLRAALSGLADMPVRVLASCANPPDDLDIPANATITPWMSYKQVMPHCALVICHGGHGTVAGALRAGCPLLVSPAGGDMYENAARVVWAGVGKRLPRYLTKPQRLRTTVRHMLNQPLFRQRAQAIANSNYHDEVNHQGAELI
jgi:UDP:flavonoid glycosyltransferase YjiC (YdhE family)